MVGLRDLTDFLRPVYIFCMDPNGAESAERRHQANLDPAHPYSKEDYLKVYRKYEGLIEAGCEAGKPIVIREFNEALPLDSVGEDVGDFYASTIWPLVEDLRKEVMS